MVYSAFHISECFKIRNLKLKPAPLTMKTADFICMLICFCHLGCLMVAIIFFFDHTGHMASIKPIINNLTFLLFVLYFVFLHTHKHTHPLTEIYRSVLSEKKFWDSKWLLGKKKKKRFWSYCSTIFRMHFFVCQLSKGIFLSLSKCFLLRQQTFFTHKKRWQQKEQYCKAG